MNKKTFSRNKTPEAGPVLVIRVVVIMRLAKRVLGFENCKPDKFLKSPDLDAITVSIQLAKLEADMNWTKRLLWLMICGGTAGFYFS